MDSLFGIAFGWVVLGIILLGPAIGLVVVLSKYLNYLTDGEIPLVKYDTLSKVSYVAFRSARLKSWGGRSGSEDTIIRTVLGRPSEYVPSVTVRNFRIIQNEYNDYLNRIKHLQDDIYLLDKFTYLNKPELVVTQVATRALSVISLVLLQTKLAEPMSFIDTVIISFYGIYVHIGTFIAYPAMIILLILGLQYLIRKIFIFKHKTENDLQSDDESKTEKE